MKLYHEKNMPIEREEKITLIFVSDFPPLGMDLNLTLFGYQPLICMPHARAKNGELLPNPNGNKKDIVLGSLHVSDLKI